MTGSCRLNNMNMRSYRREGVYQTLVIDLAMLGVISKEECEMLIGAGIPKGLRLPDGTPGSFISTENVPEGPVITDEPDTVVSEETETQEPVDDEGTTESNN